MSAIINELILVELKDNAKLSEVPPPFHSTSATEHHNIKEPPKYCIAAMKNTRRTMEDKHVVIDDFNAYFNVHASFNLNSC